MKNYRKSLKELIQVNPEAGFLRLFLVVVLIFILWSLMAVISAIFNPLGKINLGNVIGLNSQNLALSLFLDILKAYFSIFTISFLIIFLSIFYLSYESIAGFYFRIKSFPSRKNSKDYLSFCAFSFPKPKKLLIPDDLNNSTSGFSDGPLKIAIKPGYALLICSQANYSVKFNNGDNSDNFEISLAHDEKIIDCFGINPASISFKIENNTHSISFMIELAYSFDLPAGRENMSVFSNMLAMFDSRKMRKIIEEFLISETRVLIYQHFRNFAGSPLFSVPHSSEKSMTNRENKPEEAEQKKNIMFLNRANKITTRVNKRNRKRPIYISPSHSVVAESKNHDETLLPSLEDQLNEFLAINLNKAMHNFFGTKSIRAKIIKIIELEKK